MADMGEARSATRDAVVRPLSRVAGRPCARPGCPTPARATLSFRYATREAWLEKLHDESSPATYDLCGSHADRTRPPTGWGIVDERPAEDQERAEPAPTRDLGDEHTVAVLAAALRAVPVTPPTVAEPQVAEPQVVEPPVAESPVVDVDEDPFTRDEPIALDDLDLPADVRHGIEDALAELAAVARGDTVGPDADRPDAPEQIAIELDEEPHPVEPATPASGRLVPRPVRAARERAGDDLPGGPARAW